MERNWRDMDADVLDAPSGWSWAVGDELAHHIWQLTERTQEVSFGPEPSIMLESMMGFFDEDHSMTESLNNWYLTRAAGQQYDTDEWHRVGAKFKSVDTSERPFRSSTLYSEQETPHPLRSKLHSQQYTRTGAMFTYELTQWQGSEASVFVRIPVPSEMLDDATEEVEQLPFERFELQSRTYREQFSDGPTPRATTFSHPHFRSTRPVSSGDLMDLFDTAFSLMKRAVRMERGG